jgi:hypothetical protein
MTNIKKFKCKICTRHLATLAYTNIGNAILMKILNITYIVYSFSTSQNAPSRVITGVGPCVNTTLLTNVTNTSASQVKHLW